MYGQIHVCVKELVEEQFGTENWLKILKHAEFDELEHFLVFHRYDDSMTFKLIGSVCAVLEAPLPTVLEIFGGHFLTYCLRHGYDKMLRTLGGDFRSFIQNLDSLHSLLALTYKDIAAPSFRCDLMKDGSLQLHYYTIRPGLYPIVLGLIRAVAKVMYNQGSEVEVLEKSQEEIGGTLQEHVVFKVLLFDSEEDKAKKIIIPYTPSFPSVLTINAEQFCTAFPYHIIFDKNLVIKQVGLMIQKLLYIDLTGKTMGEVFKLVHPMMALTLRNLHMFINAVFMLTVSMNINPKVPARNTSADCVLKLKGQMMWLEDIQHMIFISSPRLSSLTELMELNVYLADIPLYDVTRELVLLNQQRIAEIDIAKKLDETTTELRKISLALEVEKKKTETLLYQMLPEKVANDLKNNRTVEAEKFDSVTILFSDIVTFTNIAAACPAMSVVNMLNDLYFKFDHYSSIHGVYKVETIGDAYMIVSGVPERNDQNAQPVANFALDMVTSAAEVASPATGKPLQIRVGFHSGPVVAGVVGKKMPRYCLFGDTVNTASRMESHGIPGRIHVSPTSFKQLHAAKAHYKMRARGEIEVKGKGKMTTFFLLGSESKTISEPDDGLESLPLITTDSEELPEITIPVPSKTKLARKSWICRIA